MSTKIVRCFIVFIMFASNLLLCLSTGVSADSPYPMDPNNTTVQRYQYGDDVLTGKAIPNAIVAFVKGNPDGDGINWRFDYFHYAKADSNGNFKLYSAHYSPGQILDLDTYSSTGEKLDSDKVYVFKGSYHTLDSIVDTTHDLTGTTVKNTKVEVIKDGTIIASGVFSSSIKLSLPELPAGTFLTIQLTTGSNIDRYQKMVQARKISLTPTTKWSSFVKGETAIPNAKIIFTGGGYDRYYRPLKINQSILANRDGSFEFSFDNAITSTLLNNNTFQVLDPVYENVLYEQKFTLRSTAPTINPITQLSTAITGTATPGSNIKVLDGMGEMIAEGQTDSNGNYNIPVASLIGGDLITVQSYMPNNLDEVAQALTDVEKVYVEEINEVNATIDGTSTFGNTAVVEVTTNNTVSSLSYSKANTSTKKYGPYAISPGKMFKLKTGILPAGAKVKITLADYSKRVTLPEMTVKQVVTRVISPSQVTVLNYKGKADLITVKGITKNSIIKVYNKSTGGLALIKKQATSTQANLSLNQLGKVSGTIYITVTIPGLKESKRVAVKYKGEKTDSLKTNQIKIYNNKKKKDVISVNNLRRNDVIRVYSKSGRLVGVSSPAKGDSLKISIKQIGKKAGKVYLTVTSGGMLESSRTGKTFKTEK